MSRNEILWSILQTLPQGPIKDEVFVAATTQVIDECPDQDRLTRVGNHLKNEQMADCDRDMLRRVYKIRAEELSNAERESQRGSEGSTGAKNGTQTA